MSFRDKIKLTYRYIFKVLKEMFVDLQQYYLTLYPFLLIIGAFKRIRRRLKILWLPKGRGRPAISATIVDLILEMKRENWNWGALRISQELRLLGVKVHKKTIQKILKENGYIPPPMRFVPPPWKYFLKNHISTWGMDFTTVFDNKGLQVFILVLIDFTTREIVSINASYNPNRNWIIQALRNASIDGNTLPSKMIIDNDGIYGKWIEKIFREFEIDVIRIPKGAPWCNAITERVHLSLKKEILNRTLLIDDAHARKLCSLYQDYYNNYRPHQGINGNRPSKRENVMPLNRKIQKLRYKKISEIDGLVTRFDLAA